MQIRNFEMKWENISKYFLKDFLRYSRYCFVQCEANANSSKLIDQKEFLWVEQRRPFSGNSCTKLFTEITHQGAGSQLATSSVAIFKKNNFRSQTMEEVISKPCSYIVYSSCLLSEPLIRFFNKRMYMGKQPYQTIAWQEGHAWNTINTI